MLNSADNLSACLGENIPSVKTELRWLCVWGGVEITAEDADVLCPLSHWFKRYFHNNGRMFAAERIWGLLVNALTAEWKHKSVVGGNSLARRKVATVTLLRWSPTHPVLTSLFLCRKVTPAEMIFPKTSGLWLENGLHWNNSFWSLSKFSILPLSLPPSLPTTLSIRLGGLSLLGANYKYSIRQTALV